MTAFDSLEQVLALVAARRGVHVRGVLHGLRLPDARRAAQGDALQAHLDEGARGGRY